MSEHSPLPWTFEQHVGVRGCIGSIKSADDWSVAAVFNDVDVLPARANAEFIVRACNSHERLVGVIREYLEWGAMTGSDRDLFDAKFRDALTLAEATTHV